MRRRSPEEEHREEEEVAGEEERRRWSGGEEEKNEGVSGWPALLNFCPNLAVAHHALVRHCYFFEL